MADALALRFVETTLALRRSHPQAPALDVLVEALKGIGTRDFDFTAHGQAFNDWTDPDSPFGEVLRQAFAAGAIGPDAAAVWSSDKAAADELLQAWQDRVLDRFVTHFDLWGG